MIYFENPRDELFETGRGRMGPKIAGVFGMSDIKLVGVSVTHGMQVDASGDERELGSQ